MPQDHRTSKEDFPLAEAKRLRAEGQSIQAVADAIGWSFAQTRRKLLASTEPASANATQTKVQPANPATPTTEKIPIADIIVDAGTQMRQSLNLSTIAEYTEAMEEGSKFPPIVVFSDGGSYWLADGFQRIEAAKVVGYRDIEAQVRPGTLRDAILHACSANATHGERRTNADKRKSVLTLLHDPEWQMWSDNHIAGVCAVTHTFVANIRREIATVASDHSKTRRRVDKYGKTSTINTSHIGRGATGAPAPSPAPQPVLIEFDEPPSHELPFAGNERPTSTPADLPAETTLTMPSRCATCAEVVTLIDDALSQLNATGYLEVEQILLTVRRLVTEKTAVGDA